MVNLKLRWLPSLSALLAAAVVSAAPPPPDVEGPFGRVRVSGGGYHDARDTARKVEDVLSRLETLGGRPYVTHTRPFVRLVLPATSWGPPSLDVTPSSNGLPWLIVMQGSYDDNAPDLYAHLARLALSLWTGQGGRPLGRGDWLAVGMAGNLFPPLKARNRELAQQLAEEGRLPSLATIVTWNRIPDGPMMEKAAATLAVSWMMAGPKNGDLPALLGKLEEGKVTGDWIIALESARVADPEAAWRKDAVKGDILAGGLRSLSPLLFRQFRNVLLTPPAELGLDGSPVPPLTPYQLLAVRGSPGVREAALARAEKIQKFAVGSPPELVAVALEYKTFFEGMAGRSLRFLLARRLEKAEAALVKLEDDTAARMEWLDGFDEAAAQDATVAPFEKSALERYMDQAEARAAVPAAREEKE